LRHNPEPGQLNVVEEQAAIIIAKQVSIQGLTKEMLSYRKWPEGAIRLRYADGKAGGIVEVKLAETRITSNVRRPDIF
jgi:hypothetical protein